MLGGSGIVRAQAKELGGEREDGMLQDYRAISVDY